MKRIRTEVLRIQGEAVVEVWVDDALRVTDVRFVPGGFRGFESFCRGRVPEEMPFVSARICGVCAEAHYVASAKAVEELYGVSPSLQVERLRAVFHLLGFIRDHLTTLYLFSGPDLFPEFGNDSLEWLEKSGFKREFFESRRRIRRMLEVVSGRGFLGGAFVPGGWTKVLTPEALRELRRLSEEELAFCRRTLEFFGAKRAEETQFRGKFLCLKPGDVSEFFGDKVACFDERGRKVAEFKAERYAGYIKEKDSGEFVFSDGSVYAVGPFARTFFWEGTTSLGESNPSFVRAREVVVAAERLRVLLEELEGEQRRQLAPKRPVKREAVGVVEAPRGLLIHHYFVDENGLLSRVKIVTPTAQNAKAIEVTLRNRLKLGQKIDEKVLKDLERVVRSYDPCIPCMVHVIGVEGKRLISVKKV